MNESSGEVRKYQGDRYELAAGEAVNIKTAGANKMRAITGAGATLTYSEVDNGNATAHATQGQGTQAASLDTELDVSWPWMRFSVAGGTARLVPLYT